MTCDCSSSTLRLQTAVIQIQKLDSETRALSVNWCPALSSGVTISSDVWDVTSGTVEISGEDLEGELASALVSGGAPGELAIITNTVTLDTGAVITQHFEVYITPAYDPVVPHC